MLTLLGYMDDHSTVISSRLKIRKWLLRFVELVIVVLVSVGMVWVFQLPVCNVLFLCGCTWQWDGAAAECNAFNDEDPYSCPWCSVSTFAIIATQIILVLSMVIPYYSLTFLEGKIFSKKQEIDVELTEFDDYLESSQKNNTGILYRGLFIAGKIILFFLSFFVAALAVGLLYYLFDANYPYFIWDHSN